MTFTRRLLLLVFVISVSVGCKQKKKVSLSGDEPVEVSDFIAFFQPVRLPFQFADSALKRREKDSLLISSGVFTQFVPDSVLAPVFGKEARLKMYPLGKAEVSKGETYLFAKLVAPTKRAAYILVFDKQEKFMAALPVLRSDQDGSLQRTTVMDQKYTITKTQVRKNPDGSVSEAKDIYAFSPDSKNFMLIMTDAMGDQVTELINPIDTFGRKHKYAADYPNGKMNLVSIRDGRKPDRLNFFIHFEKNNGECTGELRGEALMRSANLAEYRLAGDPCVLQFRFTASSVTLHELEGCGSRRGLRCTFDGVFPRKKEAKPKPAKKKSTTKK